MYFWRTETRGTTASAGILFTVLSMSSKSALSSTESRMRVSLLWSPWARSCASVSVRGAAVEFWDEGWVESRERRSWDRRESVRQADKLASAYLCMVCSCR